MHDIHRLLLLPGLLIMLLAGCQSAPPAVNGIQPGHGSGPGSVSARWVESTTVPTLVISAERGIGRLPLRIKAKGATALQIEFPGYRQMESLTLTGPGPTLRCNRRGDTGAVSHCVHGERWPVGRLQRYETGMTLTLPADVLSPGKWTLEWVDQWRQ